MDMKEVSGGCHCGNIHYKAVIDSEKVIICHCQDCQILSGSIFRTIVVSNEDNLSVTGKLKEYVKTASSGNRRIQAFCPECGTHIYATSVGDSPKMYALRAGTSDQRDELQPTMEIWCDSAISWNRPLEGTKKSAQQT